MESQNIFFVFLLHLRSRDSRFLCSPNLERLVERELCRIHAFIKLSEWLRNASVCCPGKHCRGIILAHNDSEYYNNNSNNSTGFWSTVMRESVISMRTDRVKLFYRNRRNCKIFKLFKAQSQLI